MIRLGELVAAVLNEVAVARMQAALFGKQMAEDFRGHKVLREIPVPELGIRSAEILLPFAVVEAAAASEDARPALVGPSDAAAAARTAAAALPKQARLKDAFSLYPDQADAWRRAAPADLAKRLAAAFEDEAPVSAVSAVFGPLVKNLYLMNLMERKKVGARLAAAVPLRTLQQTVASKSPDLVEETAVRLLKQELEKRIGARAEKGAAAKGPPGGAGYTPPISKGEPLLFVEVDPERLKQAQRVATLRLEIEEGPPGQWTVSETEVVDDE